MANRYERAKYKSPYKAKHSPTRPDPAPEKSKPAKVNPYDLTDVVKAHWASWKRIVGPSAPRGRKPSGKLRDEPEGPAVPIADRYGVHKIPSLEQLEKEMVRK